MAYKERHGHCNVPSNYSEDPALGSWVKSQRRNYKLLRQGLPSNMTRERFSQLQALGFEWRCARRSNSSQK